MVLDKRLLTTPFYDLCDDTVSPLLLACWLGLLIMIRNVYVRKHHLGSSLETIVDLE